MRRLARAAACLALCALAGGILLAGCDSGPVKATKQEQADFKGKPMPPEVAQAMQRRMAENARLRNQMMQNRGQQAPPGP